MISSSRAPHFYDTVANFKILLFGLVCDVTVCYGPLQHRKMRMFWKEVILKLTTELESLVEASTIQEAEFTAL